MPLSTSVPNCTRTLILPLFSTTSTPPTVLVPTEGFNATLQMVSLLASVLNVCTPSYSPVFISYVWTDEMGTKLLKNSFEELVTTSAGNLMVTKIKWLSDR